MKRLVLALVMGALLVLAPVSPASAQYGGNPPPEEPPAGPPEGCPVEDPPPADPPPCNPRATADVSDSTVRPGDEITVSTPPVFEPGTTVTINMVRAQRSASASELGTETADADGVDASVTIPDVPPGVYFIYVYGTGPDGSPVVAMTPIVVRGGPAAAAQGVDDVSVQGDAVYAAAAAAAPVPVQVAEVQGAVSPEVEAAVVDAVASGGRAVLSPEGTLNVRTAAGVQRASALPTTGSDGIATQVTIGAAMLFAGTGLVLLRRRKGAFVK